MVAFTLLIVEAYQAFTTPAEIEPVAQAWSMATNFEAKEFVPLAGQQHVGGEAALPYALMPTL
ncbi:hypothetical protein [Geobacter argillaceus]|uniref:Uncharacterized protein n=1 Tax=Geobacter argillaceus TaxID=345631 RepID=A0A562V6L8_9BACT|nr:hypothetical protein [Geobacter argillaceus]TWJ13397.1 hypothetical protein JN12_03887 [Geobacter argillaceus]